MSTTEITTIVKKYAEVLRARNYPFSAIYLFGSQMKGKAHRGSDIDVAVISHVLAQDDDVPRFALWNARMGVDLRIEPHGFTEEDFQNNSDPLAYEIRKTGMRVM